MCAVLAIRDRCQEVGRIQVHTGQGGQYLHADAGLGADGPGRVAQAAVPDDVALVVAAAFLQRGKVSANVQTYGLFLGKIHRRALHRQLAPGGDAVRVGLKIIVGVNGQAVAQGAAAGVAVQVKITVIRHIADGGRISGGPIADDQPALCQAVLDGQRHVAGKAVGARGADGGHRHAVGLARGQLHIKHRVAEPVQATVQAVSVLIRRHMDDLLIQGELRPRNAVGKAAHGGPHAVGIQLVVGGSAVAQHHIHRIALAVRHDDTMNNGGITQQLHLDKVIFQHGQLDGLAGGGLAEITDRNRHTGTSLLFGGNTLGGQVLAHALGHAAGAVVQHTVHAADRGAGCAGLAADLAVDLALQKAPGHSVALLHRAQLGHGAQVVKKADALIQRVQPQDRLIQGGITFILLHSVVAQGMRRPLSL